MWTVVDVGGKPLDVFDPSGSGSRLALIFLHGVGQETLPERAVYTRRLEEEKIACVCPHGDVSWWTDRIWPAFDAEVSAEQYVVGQVLPFCRQRWGVPERGVGLLGISMGGQGALRIGFKHPRLFPAVAGISSALDYHEWYGQGYSIDQMYDSKEQCRQDTALLHLHPAHYPRRIFFCIDPDDHDWVRGNDRLHEKMNALGVPHEIDFTNRAGGHSWEYFDHMAARSISFLRDSLDQESRRLL
jgi:S-formylglutathione hydrolase